MNNLSNDMVFTIKELSLSTMLKLKLESNLKKKINSNLKNKSEWTLCHFIQIWINRLKMLNCLKDNEKIPTSLQGSQWPLLWVKCVKMQWLTSCVWACHWLTSVWIGYFLSALVAIGPDSLNITEYVYKFK